MFPGKLWAQTCLVRASVCLTVKRARQGGICRAPRRVKRGFWLLTCFQLRPLGRVSDRSVLHLSPSLGSTALRVPRGDELKVFVATVSFLGTCAMLGAVLHWLIQWAPRPAWGALSPPLRLQMGSPRRREMKWLGYPVQRWLEPGLEGTQAPSSPSLPVVCRPCGCSIDTCCPSRTPRKRVSWGPAQGAARRGWRLGGGWAGKKDFFCAFVGAGGCF